MKLLFEKESYAIRGAVFEVYREMGCGFLEAVYQECLEKEFDKQNIPYISQCELKLTYKGEFLDHTYRPDFLCYGSIVVEIKATKEILPEHKAQLLNYLKATQCKLGFLVSFGSHQKAIIERFVL